MAFVYIQKTSAKANMAAFVPQPSLKLDRKEARSGGYPGGPGMSLLLLSYSFYSTTID